MEQALPYILAVIALVCLWASHRTNRKRRLIGNLPTSKAQGVFVGLVELSGTAECEAPVQSYLAEISCVTYSFSVSEHWRREVQETYTDSEGRQQTRTRIESGWTSVHNGGEQVPFYLQDETGVVLVRPDGAEIRPRTVFQHTCGPMDPLYYGKGPPGSVMGSTHTRSFTEMAIPLHQQLFVVGQAREREDIVAAELAHDGQAPLYLVTVESESQVLSRMGWSLHSLSLLGLCFAGGVGYLWQQWPGVIVTGGIYLGIWILTWFVLVYNMLVDLRNRVKQGWSALEVQFKRRHDLIPRLVEIVTGFRDHEQTVQQEIAKLRGQMVAVARRPDSSGAGNLHAITREIRVIAEKYPTLQADASFLELQRGLSETEQRIALARNYFNDIATALNIRLEIVPDGWIARLFGFRKQPLLYAEEFERAAIQVQLAR